MGRKTAGTKIIDSTSDDTKTSSRKRARETLAFSVTNCFSFFFVRIFNIELLGALLRKRDTLYSRACNNSLDNGGNFCRFKEFDSTRRWKLSCNTHFICCVKYFEIWTTFLLHDSPCNLNLYCENKSI